VDRTCQFKRPRGRFHASLPPLEQSIVEKVTQPVKGLAHRRLAEPVVPGGARDMAFGHQCIEDHKQVKIDAT
jgi:hypothetical protein